MRKKSLMIILCMVLAAFVSVLGTLAYLTDSDSAVNTFTVGHIEIELDEAAVDKHGQLILDHEGNPIERVHGNTYHLIPGQTYVKDPTITVKSGSELSYIRMLFTISNLKELDHIFASEGADLTTIFGGYDSSVWNFAGETKDEITNTITYEFRYKEAVAGETGDVVLAPLFDTFTLPGTITGEDLKAIQGLTITVEGHAIQTAGFEDNTETGESAEAIAWRAFEEQGSPTV